MGGIYDGGGGNPWPIFKYPPWDECMDVMPGLTDRGRDHSLMSKQGG